MVLIAGLWKFTQLPLTPAEKVTHEEDHGQLDAVARFIGCQVLFYHMIIARFNYMITFGIRKNSIHDTVLSGSMGSCSGRTHYKKFNHSFCEICSFIRALFHGGLASPHLSFIINPTVVDGLAKSQGIIPQMPVSSEDLGRWENFQ